MAGRGQPRINKDEKLEIVSFGMPPSEHKALKAMCKALGQSKSKIIRHALKLQYHIGASMPKAL